MDVDRQAGDSGYETAYGFQWGNIELTRLAFIPKGTRVLEVKIDDGARLTIYVSPKGKSVRVFKNGTELK